MREKSDKNTSLETPFDGYTLFAPEYHTDTFLINNEKETIHTWYADKIQAMGVYLLENGNIIRTSFPNQNNTMFLAGGRTGRVEIRDWYSRLIWEFEYSNDNHCLHHDITVMPNGNILMIAWESHTRQEAIQAGRNPIIIQKESVWSDYIIEVKPMGHNEYEIVWEWHVWDHLIQDFDSTKDNYGIVKENPGRIDVNFEGLKIDWNHINSIDYHEGLDQILLSSKGQNEIWVIDHSTTTEEAAGSSGGRYGKGGDLLYRWGNPQVYDHGTSDDQKLFSPHDAHWIPENLLGEGNILVFNNGVKRPEGSYSSVEELQTPLTLTGNYRYNQYEPFEPKYPLWYYSNGENFFSSVLSSAQRLENGNTLICEGMTGRFFEVTMDHQNIWEYTNPYGIQKSVFRATRYPLDYPGFLDIEKPLTPDPPEGPIISRVGKTCYFNTQTIDPNNGQLYYQWNFQQGSYTDWIGPYESGEQCSIEHYWSSNGLQTIQVRAKNTEGFISEWASQQVYVTKPKISQNPFISWFLSIIPQLLYNDILIF